MHAEPTPDARRWRRTIAPLLVVALLTIAAIGGIGYVFRERLTETPLFSSWFARNQHQAADHITPGTSGSPASHSEGAGHRVELRAPISLDARRQQLIGVRTAAVERTELMPTVRAAGTVRYDETRLADVNLKLEGWIRELYVNFTGESIRQGQPLFTIYSPDLLATQNEYLLALKTRDRLRQSQVADARESADRLVDSARQRLELWDLPPEEFRALEETRQPRATVVFQSPVNGYVIEKHAVQGMHVMPGQTLYRVADLSGVWVEADIYEQEIPLVRVGRTAVVTLDAYSGRRFTGRVVYVYPFVEEKTRTVRVRFEFANPGGHLKPGMYANVELQAPTGMGLTVPANAIIDSGRQQIVFLALGDGYFEPRQVKVGRRMGERVEILENLKEGEQVATGATFFLDSESQLRGALQGYEPPPSGATAPPAGSRPDITFRTQPDPPRLGDNTFEVTVKDSNGQAIPDGAVSVVFFMAAMPTMGMPAMRSQTKLAPVGNGVYRGAGQVLARGSWDVTVTVSRGGQEIGRRQLTVTAP